jgi:Fic family protein
MMRSLSAQKEISEEYICKLHSVLMNGIREDAGQYRNHGVRITGSNVVTANCLKVPVLMKSLMEDIAAGNKDVIGFAAKIHSRFEQIHPFSDGNGRVGRLLLTSMMLKEDLAPAMILQAQRRFYIMYLNQSQLGGDYSRLENFVCDAVLAGYDVLKENS